MQTRKAYSERIDHDRPAALSGGWQIIYTGFILIMLSFFILLTSFASLETSKVNQFAQSFSTAVSVFQHGDSIEESEVQHGEEISLVTKEDRVADLFKKIHTLGNVYHLDGIRVRRNESGVVITLSDTLLFVSGEARLDARAFPMLEKIGGIIENIGLPVEIEGHTDNKPIQNDMYPSNWELSTARAVNVLRFLVQQGKVPPEHIAASGRSEHHPLLPNDTEENRAANRRVEFIFNVD
jgi:chemotaxis protein MotB